MDNQSNHQDEYDSPWKEGIELYFKEFMEFFFPQIAGEIDWGNGYEFLDKELQSVVSKNKGHKGRCSDTILMEMEDHHGTL
jgi:hypothetical protein